MHNMMLMIIILQILHQFAFAGANSAKIFMLLEMGAKYCFTCTLNQQFIIFRKPNKITFFPPIMI